MSELYPCPHCGSKRPEYTTFSQISKRFCADCDKEVPRR
jgi:DNA-directed RNA polymerase subunit RPC12/RpoP